MRHLGGWKPDMFDHRDYCLVAKPTAIAGNSANLRPHWTLDIRDQGGIGSCTANGTLEAACYDWVRDGKPDPQLSRLFTYWVSRVKMENTDPLQDSGCCIRDVVKGYAKYGSCFESLYPYIDDGIQFTKMQSTQCFDEALLHKGLFYYRCPNLNTIKASIAQGFPVIFGFPCPDNFMSQECANTGIIKMPAPDEGFDGGHCMIFAGWNDTTKMLDGVNSWGNSWGDKGWFHMPYGMVEQGFVDDCWTIRKVQE